jgi:hypothetical protein
MTHTATMPAASPHPIRLVVNDDLQRSRLTVFFRLVLAIPHLIWLGLWSIAAFFAVIVAWVAALVGARVPDGVHAFLAAYVRYVTHVTAYLALVADPFPGLSGASGSYPIDADVDPPAQQSRVTVLFRPFLVIPAAIVLSVLQDLVCVLAVLQWFYVLWTGHAHEGLRNVCTWCLRFQAQTLGYAALLTERYPSFSAPSAA